MAFFVGGLFAQLIPALGLRRRNGAVEMAARTLLRGKSKAGAYAG